MTQNTQYNCITAASRHCEGGTTKAIQTTCKKPKVMVWIASFLAMTLGLFTSCEKEIEFNGEQSDPKLVINSIVEPGQRVDASISKSYFFLDPANTTAPEDLVASLYVNDHLVGEMTPFMDTIWEAWSMDYRLIPGFYNDYCAQEGDIVKITASANGFDDVEGTTSPVPDVVDCQMEVEVTEWHSNYIFPYYYEPDEYEEDSILSVWGNLTLTITITDHNPGKTDCFRLSTSKNYGIRDEGNWRYISFDYDDPVFGATVSENDFFDASDLDTRPEGVFTDVLFDGSSYRLKVKVHFECEVDEEFDPDFFRIPFMMEHLSKEYYNYLNTCNQGDEYTQFFAEPVQTYSNVTNGFGIVAGRSLNTQWLALPIEEP